MTGLNIREESYIHESILFGFHESSDDVIIINYCMLYAKYYIYLKKLKEENKKENLMQTFWGICAISNIYSRQIKVFVIGKIKKPLICCMTFYVYL